MGSLNLCACTSRRNRIHPFSPPSHDPATPIASPGPHRQTISTPDSGNPNTASPNSRRNTFEPLLKALRKLKLRGHNQRNVIGDEMGLSEHCTSPEELWASIDRSCQPSVMKRSSRALRDRAWRTAHIFVAATFSDFNNERALLFSEVFPSVAKWCADVHMQLVPIDLYWGLSKQPQTFEFFLSCLKEIDRCQEDNMPMFFIVLLSERLGWVPSVDEIPRSVCEHYGWVPGMSLLETMIIYAAYKNSNQNAIFLMRESSFLNELPEEYHSLYVDPDARERLELLKSKLMSKFPEQVFSYHCPVLTSPQTGDNPKLEPSPFFKRTISEFFITRIRKEFQLETGAKRLLAVHSDLQTKEMERLNSTELIGKNIVMDKMTGYIENSFAQAPLLLTGEVGSGKSTVIAKCAEMYITKQKKTEFQSLKDTSAKKPISDASDRVFSAPIATDYQRSPHTWNRFRSNKPSTQTSSLLQEGEDTSSVETIPLIDHLDPSLPVEQPVVDNTWHIFYHFIGSIPYSSDLRHILQRLWFIESLGEPKSSPIPTESNALEKEVLNMLSKRGRKKYLIFIDGIDRIKDEYHSNVLKWIPAKLPQSIRMILSLSPTSETKKVFNSREPKCPEIRCGSLNLSLSRQHITHCLLSHSLPISQSLVDALLGKLGVCNPQYVMEVCNELARESYIIDNLDEIAKMIPGDLTGLYDHIISCLEDEAGGRIAIAALCLLECSRFGLQESELLDMLGALSPLGYSSEADNASRVTAFGHSVPNSAQHNRRLESTPHLQQHHMYSRDRSPTFHIDSEMLLAATASTAPDTLGVSGYAASNKPRPESSLYTPSPQTSRSQLRSPQGCPASHSSVADLEDYSDQDLIANITKIPPRPSSHSLELPTAKSSSSQSPNFVLPGAIEPVSTNEMKLSPASAKRHHAQSSHFDQQQLPVVASMSPEGTPSMANLRKPHRLPPSPSLSLLSAELAHIMGRKGSSSSQQSQGNESEEAEIQEIRPAGSSSDQHSPSNQSTSLAAAAGVGLERMNIIHLTESKPALKLPSYQWAVLFHRLRPFLRSIGRPGECRWAIGSKAFSRAIRRKYFKQPPTHSFPFSFCNSPMFYGADGDQNLYTTITSSNPAVATSMPAQKQSSRSVVPSPVQAYGASSRSGSSMHGAGNLVHKRFDWWHARLAGYFSVCSNEGRRAEELPYHLARIQNYGRLSHCLVHFPVFELLSTPECVMDLCRFWRCAGGYNNAVSMYHHALDELEISGASGQEMVKSMQRVALFLHTAGESEAAQQILVDAIELEETRLGGRVESMASLTLNITKILSHSCKKQAQYLEPRQSLESEYRLLRFASRSVEFHRNLYTSEAEHNLALLLRLLSVHLLHYATLGGSADLSVRHATEEAQEMAQEAVDIYSRLEDHGNLLEAYLHLASTFESTARKSIQILEEAHKVCQQSFGEMNDSMLQILCNLAVTYDLRLALYDTAEPFYRKWVQLTVATYGDSHAASIKAKGQLTEFFARIKS